MKKSRRGFLAIAGGSLLGGVPLAARALASGNDDDAAQAGECVSNKWAMVVNLSKCRAKEGCTACQEACHAEHNVPSFDNKKEEIKWIWKEPYENVFPEQIQEFTPDAIRKGPIPILCNHCENPPCVKVCPTKATWKRTLDGIVMMDMHRCIGCRYCMVGCPYGSRSFNFSDPRPHIPTIRTAYPTRTKGVVEKCDFCAERLAKGMGPVCVEAAKKAGCNALVFGDLMDPRSEVVALLKNHNTLRRKPELGTAPQVYYIV